MAKAAAAAVGLILVLLGSVAGAQSEARNRMGIPASTIFKSLLRSAAVGEFTRALLDEPVDRQGPVAGLGVVGHALVPAVSGARAESGFSASALSSLANAASGSAPQVSEARLISSAASQGSAKLMASATAAITPTTMAPRR